MRALAEIEAIVRKAALGADIPLGQADNLGRTACFVAGTGGDLGMIVAALTAPLGPVDVQWGGNVITVVSGPVALIAPVVRDAFKMGLLRAELADAEQVPLVVAMLEQVGIGVRVADTLIVQNGVVAPAEPLGPVVVPDAYWMVFKRFAAKTYVPDTKASRAAGAGAGIGDND